MTFYYTYDPFVELDRLFEDAFTVGCDPNGCVAKDIGQAALRRRHAYRPRLDLYETKDGDTVTAVFELPGLTSESVAIDVHQDRLTVAGELSTSTSDPPKEGAEEGGYNGEEGRTYVIRERRARKFSRTLQLPSGTNPEDVKARMENGVLTITFPKTAPEQPTRRVIIQ